MPPSGDEWLEGWDGTPGIVSVWVERDGAATVWRRSPGGGPLVREESPFRPWILLDSLDDLRHLGLQLGPEGASRARVTFRRLEGPGELAYRVSADRIRTLTTAVLYGAGRRLGRRLTHLRQLGRERVLALPPEEQYLVATGRTYFRGLAFDDVRRMQFDLETTGLDPGVDRIFMIAVRKPEGEVEVLEAEGRNDRAEAALIVGLIERVRMSDPDVIENHNLHGFDLPFLQSRARRLGVGLALGRAASAGLRERAARRGMATGTDGRRRVRLVAPGRELIDTMDAVLRHDFSARDLPGHGLKDVARHLGFGRPESDQIPGDQVYATWRADPERARRYAKADVEDVARVSRVFGGAAFALASMVPRRYERVADAGAATGVVDPLLARAYLREGMALPAHRAGRDAPHQGAALHLFASGVARRVVKADVASLYPSLMRAHRIGPARDHLGAMLAIVDRLVERRLEEKNAGRAAPPGSLARSRHEATSAAMKLVVNSAYGYLAAGGALTRFADVDAANEVTRRGRETLSLICSELRSRGGTLLEADTDGVYFAAPEGWGPAEERAAVAEVAALLPPLVHLEFEGRYAAMLSHEPKNYALLTYDGKLVMRGVAFRSSRVEPYAAAFLDRAVRALLTDDIPGVQAAFLETASALRHREYSAWEVSARVRLSRTREQYLETRDARRELAYEAMLARGGEWSVGDRVRVYRASDGAGRLVPGPEDRSAAEMERDARDYDVAHYLEQLRSTYCGRLARAFSPRDFETVFADTGQMSLFAQPITAVRPILTPHRSALDSGGTHEPG